MNFRDAERLAEVRQLIATGEAKETRLRAGLSLAEAAEPVGVDGSTLWRWENNRKQPRRAAALRYWRLLKMLEQVGAGS